MFNEKTIKMIYYYYNNSTIHIIKVCLMPIRTVDQIVLLTKNKCTT